MRHGPPTPSSHPNRPAGALAHTTPAARTDQACIRAPPTTGPDPACPRRLPCSDQFIASYVPGAAPAAAPAPPPAAPAPAAAAPAAAAPAAAGDISGRSHYDPWTDDSLTIVTFSDGLQKRIRE